MRLSVVALEHFERHSMRFHRPERDHVAKFPGAAVVRRLEHGCEFKLAFAARLLQMLPGKFRLFRSACFRKLRVPWLDLRM